MIRIGIDMMGGDYAPEEAFKGIAQYLEHPDELVSLVMIGNNDCSAVFQDKFSNHPASFTLATEVIAMNEHPTKALKEKTDSSIAVGFKMLAENKLDAFISAGNTGAMMVGAMFSVKPVEGILRPTIGAYIPREDGSLGLLLDVGLNSDCKPEQLNQFAILGSLYAEHILHIKQPRVGLVNLGEEEGKGNILAQAAHTLLKENNQINFVGNIEGRDILVNKCDVMVCDGFTGNVVLKMAESIYDIVQRRNIQDEHFERFNFEAYGGVPVLGVAKPVIIGHGISHAHSFENMIKIAVKMAQTDLCGKISQAAKQSLNETFNTN